MTAAAPMDGKQKCRANSKQSGERCKRWPVPGAEVCKIHGGGAPGVRAAAERNLAEAAARQTMTQAVKTLGLPIDVDPGKALLDEIHWTAGHVAWLRSKVQELKGDELVWGRTEYRDKIGGEDAGITNVEQAGANVWYQLYLKEREHLAKVCSLALRAGIEERKVKLAESQGLLVADVIRRILGALGLTPAQQLLVPEIVPRELRALAAGD